MKSTPPVTYYNSADPNSARDFGEELFRKIKQNRPMRETALGRLIFLCIGSDRATGDCLGPIIGYKLTRRCLAGCTVYGTLEQPVHAGNLAETVAHIRALHEDAFLIAIDASLGRSSHIGYYTLGCGSLKPGAGVDKKLPEVGDLFITGIVNLSGCLDHMLLQTTRLNVVMTLSDRICDGIGFCIGRLLEESTPVPIPEEINPSFFRGFGSGFPVGTAMRHRK